MGSSLTSEPISAPFYDTWPLICAYALYKFYSEKGFEVTVEDVIVCPSPEDQIWLLGQRPQDGVPGSRLAPPRRNMLLECHEPDDDAHSP